MLYIAAITYVIAVGKAPRSVPLVSGIGDLRLGCWEEGVRAVGGVRLADEQRRCGIGKV